MKSHFERKIFLAGTDCFVIGEAQEEELLWEKHRIETEKNISQGFWNATLDR